MVTTNNIRKFTAKKKKRGTSTTTLVKYQKPTARNQRTQIMRNARAVKTLYKVFCPSGYSVIGNM